MRQQLESAGFKSLMNAAEVESSLQNAHGTQLLVFNSVCGCAAGTARPGVLQAVKTAAKQPGELLTVFAGQETDAVEKRASLQCLTRHHHPPSLYLKTATSFILLNAT